MEKYKDVYQIELLTDDTEKNITFHLVLQKELCIFLVLLEKLSLWVIIAIRRITGQTL